MSEDRCVCCGEIVPEGRMVCPQCEKGRKPRKCNHPDEAPACAFHYNGTCSREHNYECPALVKPNVDVVEVIRCRECRWYSKEQGGWGVCFHPHSNRLYVSEDFYCAYGTRKEKTDDPR